MDEMEEGPDMELLLAYQVGTQVSVTCDGQLSHTFDLRTLAPNKEKGVPQPLDDPVTYGKAIYQALFPPGAPAARILNEERRNYSEGLCSCGMTSDLLE